MPEAMLALVEDDDDAPAEDEPKTTERDDDISKRRPIKKKLLEIFDDVRKGFEDQSSRSDDQMDYWDIYNCELGEKQYYNGNAQVFVPLVHDAIDARKTRFSNQVFPKAGRSVYVIDENGDPPHALMALGEYYVRKAKLRTKVAPALNRNGDVEGQYNVYVDWIERERHVAWRESKPAEVDGVPVSDEEIEEIIEDTLFDGYPDVEVLSDADVLILPSTCDAVEDALAMGGSVTVLRRWSKGVIRQKIKDGDIRKDEGESLLKEMSKGEEYHRNNAKKKHADAAGIRAGGKWALVYETWTMLKVDDIERKSRAYFGGDDRILGAKLNPYWCDKCPVISAAVDKVSGQIKGISKVKAVAEMQYAANDAINEGLDSATYALLPIIMTDPATNPRIGSMILDLAAIWEVNPQTTQFAQFPALYTHAFEIVSACKNQIQQTLGVNPAMIPQSTGSRQKRNQAEIANEQQVDILTTAEAVTVQEEAVWTPIIERFMEYDAQFRSEAITIRQFGQLGQRARMEQIPPLQMGKRYEFTWFGVEQARNAAQVQQQISTANVLRGIPPNFYKGKVLDLTVIIERLVENVFGPRDAPLIFKDERNLLSQPPEAENEMLVQGFDLPVQPMDDDPKHMQAHMQALAQGDQHGVIRAHLMKHQQQMQAKAQAQQQAQQGGTAPGTPGGGPPGIAGVPPPGAQPGQPHAAKQPAGAIAPDRMAAAGAPGMPRKM